MKICLNCGSEIINDEWKCDRCGYEVVRINNIVNFAPKTFDSHEGFNTKVFSILAEHEPGNFWFVSRNKLITYILKKYFSDIKSFFEIGCGTGFVFSEIEKQLPDVNLFGSDIYNEGLEFCSNRVRRAKLFQMDARKIPFKDEFDLIGAFDVLEHISEDEAVLDQINNALHKGGGFIVTIPQHKFLWSQADEYACHVRRYSSKDIVSKLENNGFAVIKVLSFVSLLMPLMAVSRLFTKKDYDPLDEFKINNLLNLVFYHIMSFERVLIKMGIRFRFGGSLLVVAKKV